MNSRPSLAKFIASGIFTLVLVCCLQPLAQGQSRQFNEFGIMLLRTRLTYQPPAGMVETPCVANRQMNYEYALKTPGKKFEVRYALRPMDSLLVQYEAAKKDSNRLMIDPNRYGRAAFQATLLNIGLGGPDSGILPEISYFDSTAVREEFNADWGAVAFVQLGPEFGGKKYKYCVAVVIHKDNVGEAYFFYVSNKKEGMSELLDPAFHSLRFR